MANVTRRQVLKAAGAGAAVLTITQATRARAAAQQDPPAGTHTLPKLPYAYDALAPHVDERTMRIHHTLHHQAYVTGLNAALATLSQSEFQKQTVEQLLRNIEKVPQSIRPRVINHGGGHYNHSIFWEMMAPAPAQQPGGALEKALTGTFKSLDGFKARFKQAALDRFGSGWAWLVKNGNRLEIVSTPNQDNPIMEGKFPVLGLDVWEHAYYLNYQNRRAAYIDAWWNVVNWAYVGRRYDNAGK